MEAEIRRVNFFDGQFLKQGEFGDEQTYHLHMRRRLNYLLFEQDGVIEVESAEDLRFFDLDFGAKKFKVHAGVAIGRRSDAREGKEIILREDSADLDLSAVTGGEAWVTLHYEEEPVADPPSDGDVSGDTRVNEKAVVTVHATALTVTTAANGEPYVLLGKLLIDTTASTLTAEYSTRQQAQLRSSLLGVSVPPAVATVTSLSASTGTPGITITATIGGTNLSGATSVTFSGSGVTATVSGATDTQVAVEITMRADATSEARTFEVVTPQGTASSAAVPAAAFAVEPPVPAPIVTSFSPPAEAQGMTITGAIVGTSLSGATSVTFSGTGVTATVLSGGTDTLLNVEIIIDTTAGTGARTFDIVTPQGTASSAGISAAAFTVVPFVDVKKIDESSQNAGNEVRIRGTNIHDAALSSGEDAAGTTVKFVDPADPSIEFATGENPRVDGSSGDQKIKVTIPDVSGWTLTPAPVSGDKVKVRALVEFGGGSGVSPDEVEVRF